MLIDSLIATYPPGVVSIDTSTCSYFPDNPQPSTIILSTPISNRSTQTYAKTHVYTDDVFPLPSSSSSRVDLAIEPSLNLGNLLCPARGCQTDESTHTQPHMIYTHTFSTLSLERTMAPTVVFYLTRKRTSCDAAPENKPTILFVPSREITACCSPSA